MQNHFVLTGKVALITGGSRSLGLEMALAFAAAGADIVVASRKLDNCEKAAGRIRAMGRRALAVAVHAGHWDKLEPLVESAYTAFGRVDILVNNAGMSPATPSHEMSEELFDKVVSLNFKGPFRLAALLAHRMRAAGGGAIINVSSVASLIPTPHVVPYAGAKAALNAMTVSMAHEYAPTVPCERDSRWPVSHGYFEELERGATPQRAISPRQVRPPGEDRQHRPLSGEPHIELRDRDVDPVRWRDALIVTNSR